MRILTICPVCNNTQMIHDPKGARNARPTVIPCPACWPRPAARDSMGRRDDCCYEDLWRDMGGEAGSA